MNDSPTKNKARYWTGVLYNENMIENWQEIVADLLQVPFAYCIHDKDSISDSADNRKIHTHFIICFNNTTTYKNALSIFDKLSAPDKKAINKCESVINIKYMYDYLIHDTESCKKKNKFLYDKSERIVGNNFDLGEYVQTSVKDKRDILFQILKTIKENEIYNFVDFMDFITSDFTFIDDDVFEVIKTNNGFIERMIKGNYLKRISQS